jgi:hypothetical protein
MGSTLVSKLASEKKLKGTPFFDENAGGNEIHKPSSTEIQMTQQLKALLGKECSFQKIRRVEYHRFKFC